MFNLEGDEKVEVKIHLSPFIYACLIILTYRHGHYSENTINIPLMVEKLLSGYFWESTTKTHKKYKVIRKAADIENSILGKNTESKNTFLRKPKLSHWLELKLRK